MAPIEIMAQLLPRLYPIARSITGEGVRASLRMLQEIAPLQLVEVPSGTPVFDWIVPHEWNVADAYVANAAGARVVDFRAHSLHLVSYSTPIHARMSLGELRPHLHTLPEQPDLIPYRTSYYQPAWGFCLSQRQLDALPDGQYEVSIDSTLRPGSLTYGELVLPGELEDEVLISTHVCHPSLANDNLSGMLLAACLARELSRRPRRYTYRFLFLPATIGSITWLALHREQAHRIKHGLVAACVGDPGPLHYKRSRRGDAEIDRVVTCVLAESGEPYTVLDFSPYGYDERQYCSPGFNLAVGSLTRTPYGRYPQYHTSSDNLELVRPEYINAALTTYLRVVEVLEQNRTYLSRNPMCEPQLGRRGLYSSLGGRQDTQAIELAMLWVLNQADGGNSLLDIKDRSEMRFSELQEAAALLQQHDLVVEASAPATFSATTSEAARYARSKQLQGRARRLIPGGAHTYAKGEDQFPELSPGFIDHGLGCHVWDVDGNEYIEYGMGLRSVTLGHAYAPVVDAAYQAMQRGSNFTRPAAIELEAAETLLAMIPGAEMVKFAKNGSDVTTAALKLARACTGRDLVAICGDQPFFSVDDWFIGSTAMPGGVPEVIRRQTLKFRYNDLASLAALFGAYPAQIACVCMEAETTEPPAAGYLQAVIDLCHQHGALFVLDEIITGFRWHTGGAQTLYGITPDLSTFGKGLGNGFAVAALVGKAALMERGGLLHDKERVFLLSTTHGAETHSLAAAIATMRTYQEQDVIGHMHRQGESLARGVRDIAGDLGIGDYFEVAGRASNLIFVTRDAHKERSQPFRTLFMQEAIRRGVLGPSFVISYAHSDADIDFTVDAVAAALRVYYRALEDGVDRYLIGRPVKPVFRPRN